MRASFPGFSVLKNEDSLQHRSPISPTDNPKTRLSSFFRGYIGFQDEIGQLDPKKLVYIDESAIVTRDTYDYGWNEKGTRFFALKEGKRSTRVRDKIRKNQSGVLSISSNTPRLIVRA